MGRGEDSLSAHWNASARPLPAGQASRPTAVCRFQRDPDGVVDVPVQYFQSVIAIELAVTGALLWQIKFFDPEKTAPREGELPNTRLRILMALILGATLFGSLWAMVDERGSRWPAIGVTIGLAISVIPILLRVLPPLARDAVTSERDPNYGLTVAGVGHVCRGRCWLPPPPRPRVDVARRGAS